jgi:sigma-B regulation protein RsbU (phosphoserine phosphatase)
MAAFRTVIRALAEHTLAESDELIRLVDFVNGYVATTHAKANMFATMFFAVLEPSTGALSYVNAGHDPPIVRRADGSLERLEPTGPAVGLLPGLPFGASSALLQAGDTLLAYTDGVPDARNADDVSLSEARMLAVIGEADARSAGSLVAALDGAVIAHAGAAEQFDDVTLFALRRRSTSSH